jgi:hypothetical protein
MSKTTFPQLINLPEHGKWWSGYAALVDDNDKEAVRVIYRKNWNCVELAEEISKRYNNYSQLEQTLQAIRARMQGEFDHPALEKFGALNTDPQIDILSMVNSALNDGK